MNTGVKKVLSPWWVLCGQTSEQRDICSKSSGGHFTSPCSSRRSTRSLRPERSGHRWACGGRCCTRDTAPPPRTDPPRRPPTPPSHSPGWSEPDAGDGAGEAAWSQSESPTKKQLGPCRAAGVPRRTPWRGAELASEANQTAELASEANQTAELASEANQTAELVKLTKQLS